MRAQLSNPYRVSSAQSNHATVVAFLPREDGQLMTKRNVLQGDLLVTTDDENEESNRQQM
jgi:hypothetical protein